MRINIRERLQRPDVIEACKLRLAQHIGFSREHTLGLRQVRWAASPNT